MSSEELVFEVVDGIATIRLNRPDRLNAFTPAMLDAWGDAIEVCKRDAAVRAVVLTGTGRGFCSGGDVRAMRDRHQRDESAFERKTDMWERIHRIPKLLEDFDKPYIVAINGVAVGAGLDMALMGDIRFAAASARMGKSYIKVGLVAGDGGTWFLPRLVGTAKALELLWTGDIIDAQEAERIGIVNKVLPDDALLPHTYEFARRLAAAPAMTLRLMKRAVYQGLRMGLPRQPRHDLVASGRHQHDARSSRSRGRVQRETAAAFHRFVHRHIIRSVGERHGNPIEPSPLSAALAGLAMAQALRFFGIRAEISEAASQLGEIGAAINASPNANKSLILVGLGEPIAKVGTTSRGTYTRNMQTGDFLECRDQTEMLKRFTAPYYVFHRADLLSALAEGLDPSTIHLGHRLTGLEERGGFSSAAFRQRQNRHRRHRDRGGWRALGRASGALWRR